MSLSLLSALLLTAAQVPDKPQDAPPPSAPAQTGCRPAPPPPASDQSRIAGMIAATSGDSAQAAFHVRSIREEYEILGALGLCPEMQALIQQGGHPYDMLRARDPRTGATRELWFDISSFFGHEF